MERSKLKNIVLLILLFTNLGLLFFVVRQEIREYREDARAQASAIGFWPTGGGRWRKDWCPTLKP